jgi:hypothetical protein
MTIESSSWPSNLAEWTATEEHPFYLELVGETSPAVDTTFAEVVPAGKADSDATTLAATPIYEYWWTIGHAGHSRDRRHFPLSLFGGHEDLWDRLDKHDADAGSVYFYFELGHGWRVKEFAATLKYLSPLEKQQSMWNTLATDWTTIQPFVSEAGSLATAINPIVAGGTKTAAGVLNALAKLKLSSVPQSDDIPWSVAKVAFVSKSYGANQGVLWRLPHSVFSLLGGRITGSLAVSFIPAQSQGATPADPKAQLVLTPGVLRAHAAVRTPDHAYWAPSDEAFVELKVAPSAPATAKP